MNYFKTYFMLILFVYSDEIPVHILTYTDFEEAKKLNNTLPIGLYANEMPTLQSFSLSSNSIRKWRYGVVPYVISSDYNANERAIIADAMNEFHNKTCIRFVGKTWQCDYIDITPESGECMSLIGRQRGRQTVDLGKSCLGTASAMHELMHVLGFRHEQQRPDRDFYVEVYKENIIEEAYAMNYEKYDENEVDLTNINYDYHSLMHYPDWSHVKQWGLKSMKPLFPGYNISELNTRMSVTDIQKINRLYRC